MITGYYMRIKRDDEWQAVDLADMSEAEIGEAFKDATAERVTMFVVALVQWIQEHVVTESAGDVGAK